MRRILAATMLSLLALPAIAQTPAPTPAPALAAAPAVAAPAPAPKPPRTRQTLQEHFADANTTHDGKLTLDQAKAANWRTVARDFAQIDKTQKGYVTVEDIRAEAAARREARKAATTPPKT